MFQFLNSFKKNSTHNWKAPGNRYLTILALLVGLGSFTTTAAASVTLLDAMQPLLMPNNVFNHAVGGTSEQRLAQTFTVTQTGKIKDVFLVIACTGGELNVAIYDVQEGIPETELTSKSFPATDIPDFFEAGNAFRKFRLSGNGLTVTEGEELAIVVSIEQGSCGMTPAVEGDSYSGGAAYFDSLPNTSGFIPLFGIGSPLDLPFITHIKPE